jgi:hypothetical protein
VPLVELRLELAEVLQIVALHSGVPEKVASMKRSGLESETRSVTRRGGR